MKVKVKLSTKEKIKAYEQIGIYYDPLQDLTNDLFDLYSNKMFMGNKYE